MNKKMFRAEMALNGDTYDSLAEFLGISIQSISNKVNGHSDFTNKQIGAIKARWNMTPEKLNDVFFSM